MRSSTAAVILFISVLGLVSSTERLRPDPYNDPSSEEHSSTDRVDITYHFRKRLIRFIRLGAIAQSISARTNIPRNTVFNGGASQYQDTTQTGGDHASHVVRVQHDNSLTHVDHTADYVTAMEFLGHTHRVPAWANLGIGKLIDTVQSNNVNLMASINFCNEQPTRNDKTILLDIKKKFLDAFDKKIQELRSGEQRNELTAARASINNITPEYLFSRANHYLREQQDCN